MEEKRNIKAAGFCIRSEAGNVQEGGVIAFHELNNGVAVEISVFKKEKAEAMMRSKPAGGYRVVDDFTDGRIELFTSDININYLALTAAIDTLREKFKVPISKECRKVAEDMRTGIPVKPSAVKS